MIIIPDIHGRSFWKEAVKGREEEDIVFLGDYVDCYSYEGISQIQTLENLKEIISFKKSHSGNVTLLLGNHDISYLDGAFPVSRHDFERHAEIQHLLTENLHLFGLCAFRTVGGRQFLFSHSLLNIHWLNLCCKAFSTPWVLAETIPDLLNSFFWHHTDKMIPLLYMATKHRGGEDPFGSVVWSDVRESKNPEVFIPGVYSIFGHTQLPKSLLKNNFACIDNMIAYELDCSGRLLSLDPNINIKTEQHD